MLKKENRLKKSRDFKKLYKERSIKTRFFSFRGKLKRGGETRIGIVLSKNVSQKSTERNKLKRQIREVLRKNLSHIKSGQDIAINVFPESHGLNYKEIEKNILDLLKKAKVINE